MADEQADQSSRPATWQDVISAEATKQGIDPRLALAVAKTESSFNPAAKSPMGATGLFQLMPETAKRRGVDPADPVQNIQGGIGELKDLLAQHKGDVTMALRRYNGSPTASDAATQPYVDKVLGELQPSPTPGQPPPAPAGVTTPVSTGVVPPRMAASHAKAGGPPPGLPYRRLASSKGGAAYVPAVTGEEEGPVHTAISTAAEAVNPMTPTGRRNIAGGAGAALATGAVIGSAPVSVPLALMVGAAGAAGGGMTAEAGEQMAGTKPPSMSEVGSAGLQQAAYDVGGQLAMWPVRAIGSRLIKGKVARSAEEGLTRDKTTLLGHLNDALEASKDLFRKTKAGATEANAQATAAGGNLRRQAGAEARQGLEEARGVSEAQRRTGQTLAAQGVTEAQRSAIEGEARAMMKGEHATAAAEKPYQEMVGNPPPAAEAGQKANQVIFGEGGGAANYREQAGKLVDQAAASGPDVDITPLKAEARRIIEKQITPPAEAFPRTAPLPEGEPDPKLMEDLAAGANMKVKDITKMWQEAQAAGPGSAKAKQFQQIQDAVGEFKRTTPEGQLAAAQAETQKELLKHPAMGVLGRIMNAEDTVPFAAAHAWKKELESTISKTRDDAVRSQVASLTQHMTGGLRQTLRAAGHEPYEAATAAYAKLVQPHVKGMVPKMRKLAVEEPEAVVRLLNPSQPTKAAMLVNLLTEQAAGGGGEAEGRQALEAVQAAWVHRKIIEGPGGLDKMGERLAKLPAEFRQSFLNDPKARQVLDNLKLISTAYQTAVQESERGVTAAAAGGKAEIEAAKAAGKGGTEALGDLAAQREAAARATGRETAESARLTAEQLKTQTRQAGAKAVEASVQPIRPAREALVAGKQTAAEAQREFNESTLAQTTAKGTGMRTAVDLLRVGAAAAAGHPGAIISHSYWTTVSLARLLRGPSGADLVKWAAYSPAGTRLFVKAITSKTPALALADLARTSGILDQPETQPHVPIGRKPKGQVAAVGTPPPAVR